MYRKIEVFECNFCKKRLIVEKCMEKHIETCKKNPKFYKNICFDCKFFDKSKYYDEDLSGFYCAKKEMRLATLRAKEKYGFEDCEVMPENCEEFEDEFDFSKFNPNRI
jgi:hypothetical protein